MTKLGRSILAIVIAGSLVLAGCGDDDLNDAATNDEAAADDSGDSSSHTADELKGIAAKCLAAGLALTSVVAGAFTGADLSDFGDKLDEVAKDAPAAIKKDLEVIEKAYGDFTEALEDAGFDATKPPSSAADIVKFGAAMAAAGKAFDDDEFTEASERVKEWLDAECEKG